MDKLVNFTVRKPHYVRTINEARGRRTTSIEQRFVKVQFRESKIKRTAVWEWCELDEKQFKKDGHKYNGYFFIKYRGSYLICVWFTGTNEATVIDQFPYTHKTIREVFYREDLAQRRA